jgi:predicted nucleic acid-binding protein
MTIVVDASVALRWCFQLAKSDRAEELLRSDHHFIAPDLVIAEITNAAWKVRDIRQHAGRIRRSRCARNR